MPLRVKFSQNTLNSKNRNIILTPKETNDHTVVFLNKNNNTVYAPSTWFGPDGPQDYDDMYCEGWLTL